MRFLIFFLYFLTAQFSVCATPRITYRLSMPQPHTHYFEVEMQLEDIAEATESSKNGYFDLKMAVWTPGSYLIREYAKHVETLTASANGQPVKAEKIRKNAWRIYSSQPQIKVRYRVYAYELSVRTSFLDDSHGYVNGATMFLYHDNLKNLPLRLEIEPYRDWKNISTGLKKINATTFEARNFDELVDCPIEIGNHKILPFTAAGLPHYVAMYGTAQYDSLALTDLMRRVCEAATTIIKEHPCQDYTFIVHNTNVGSGGLEHANSTTLGVNRNTYQSDAGLKSFLSLVAHEYFHLWNVKRIRPIELGPFDYENENYTRLLWVAEGFTSFYQTDILRRAGIYNTEEYWQRAAALINGVENKPGNQVQSLAEASWDAWIKYYRPNENSVNSTVSYYDKGAVIGQMLHLLILSETNGQKSLDDVMRYLYEEYYKKKQRGFSDQEMQQACEFVAGRSLEDFFQKYIYGTENLPYAQLLAPFGLMLKDKNASNTQPYLGAAFTQRGSQWVVSEVRRDSPAQQGGLNVNDEIVSIEGQKIDKSVGEIIQKYAIDATLTIQVLRAGLPKSLKITLGKSPLVQYEIQRVAKPTASQEALYQRMMNLK
ncbi:MAG: M61 family metallopeptidase [Runella sp.]